MALQGDLKDFAITSILPIIKAENQTGVLDVRYKDDVVAVSFSEGQVVYGETAPARDMKRLRDTLLANSMMARDEWTRLQKQQSDSLDSTWNVLATMISPETVGNLLKRQVLDCIFALMRFNKGEYNFIPQKSMEYPDRFIEPMDVDFLLMEGARITDEWDVMEKKLPSHDTVLRKTILADRNPDESSHIGGMAGPAIFTETLEYEVLQERGIEISENEKKLLSVIGDYRSIRDLVDMADLSHYDSGSAIVSLLQKRILAPIQRKQVSKSIRPKSGKSFAFVGYLLALFLAVAVGLAGHYRYKSLPLQIGAVRSLMKNNFSATSSSRMKEVLYALKAYYLQNGKHAGSLGELIGSDMLDSCFAKDPWGRDFQYKKRGNSFVIYSLGPEQFVKGDEIFLSLQK